MSTQEVEQHNQNILDQLDVGDLIEFKRGVYSHWAVYIGNGEVVHLSGDEDDGLNGMERRHVFTISGTRFNKATVRRDRFWEVTAGDKAHRNNSKDRKLSPYPPEEIVERALSKLGHVGYNIIFSNCEHFVSWCRYNIETSDQVNSFLTGLVVGAAALLTTAVVSYLGSGKKRKRNEEEEEY